MAAEPAQIEALLRAALSPSRVEVRDDSALHAGHAGAAAGGGADHLANGSGPVCGSSKAGLSAAACFSSSRSQSFTSVAHKGRIS